MSVQSFILFIGLFFIIACAFFGIFYLYHWFRPREMKKTIQYYATLLESSPFPAVIFRVSDLKIIALNVRAADLFRVLKEKAVSKSMLDFFVSPDDLQDIMAHLNL
ncbi:hypothetical protein, partial [Methanospirillum hungatei]|uniref:hypothetical protein n=1 Tax=Methanospirillum hungatei TaxID=2203 RepID=UPI0026EB8BF4